VNAAPEVSRRVLAALGRLAAGAGPAWASGVEAHSLEPVPVVTVFGVLRAEDAEHLVRMADEGRLWRASSRRGARSVDGTDALRTSQSAVLSSPQCFQDPVTQRLRSRVASMLDMPTDFVEGLQLVRYHRGEQYGPHVDWGRAQDASLWLGGQRTATALIYLNTLPQGCGGETVFDDLGLKVSPSAGTAVLWPNVDANGVPQPLVQHRAMPVLCDETKYAVNVWVREQSLPVYGNAAA